MSTSPQPRERRPPKHDPEGRRADVLAAARRLFAKQGYAQTSIRAIAEEADVNHALVVTYFGGKESLFMEAVGRFEIPQAALRGSTEDMGVRIARAYMERWENMAADDPWLALVRSSLSHEASYELLRAELEAQQTVPLRKALGGTGDGPQRAAMVECLIAGMILTRYIYRLEPARSLPAPAFEAALANSLQQAISGPSPPSERKQVASPGRAENNRRMPAVDVRPATLADTEGIGLVHVRSWQSAYRGKMPQSHLDGLDPASRAEAWRRIVAETEPSRGGVLAAVAEGGGIIGFASFGPSRDTDTDPQRTGEVSAIYVDPDAWGTGAGRELMAGSVAQLARLGYSDAILWVLDTNDRARRFYVLAGWAEDGASKTDGSRGFDITEVRYRKTLQPAVK